MIWTEEQDDVLREVSYRGADVVRRELKRRLGVSRSIHSIENRASRIHCSLRVRTVCPGCGAVGVRLNRQTGMCALCTELLHLEEERAFNEILEEERRRAEESEELAEAKRARDALRQKNARLCRKHGLKTKRQRKRGS